MFSLRKEELYWSKFFVMSSFRIVKTYQNEYYGILKIQRSNFSKLERSPNEIQGTQDSKIYT